MRIRHYLLLSLALIAGIGVAADISGIIKDNNDEPMSGAAVKLLNRSDSTLATGIIADEAGHFKISGVKSGRYTIEASYVGYDPVYTDVDVKSDSDDISLKPIVMTEEESIKLGEVTVKGVKTQVKVMEDTIEYNADSYKTQPNAVVEDLLKRLPGVEVGSDGKIKANGKEVSKILVDGKEFFSDDPNVASKNLPASMVDKLQVVDRKSDLARLTGVDDGEEETVINLTVKKGMKEGWFGTVGAGYGTDNRYAGSFTINRFWNDNQITFIGNANNINEMGFTDGNGRRFRRFGGDNGINTTQSFGVNFNVGNGEIFRVGGNVLYSHSDRDSRRQTDRQNLFPDSVSWQNTGKWSRDKGHNLRADFRLQWNPDSLNTFEFRPRISLNYNNSVSADSTLISAGDDSRSRVSYTRNANDSRGHSFEFAGQLIYNHKFASRPGRAFSVDARYELSNVRERGNALSRMEFYMLNDSVALYDQYSDNHTWSNSVRGRLSWTEPIGNVKNGNFLTLSYQASYKWNNADKMVYDHPVVLPEGDAEPWVDYDQSVWNKELSNSFRNDYFNQEIRLGYKRVKSAYNLEVGMALVPQMSESHDLVNPDRDIARRWVWNVAPFLNYRLKLGQRESLTLRYNGRSSQPSMAQLQPVADMSDPMSIVIGNPDLKPSFAHRMNARFQSYKAETQRSIMAMLMVNTTQNAIISQTVFNPDTGGRTTTYTNVNGVWQVMGMGMLSMPFGDKSWQFSNFLDISYNRNVGFNNGVRNVSSTARFSESPSISWRPDNIELELRPTYSFQKSWNSALAASNAAIHRYGGTFNASYYTPIGIVLNTELSYTGTSGYAKGYNNNEWLWNAQVSYQFLRDKSATVSVKAYDILNSKKDISRTVTANYIEDANFNTLTRYVMLNFTYKFNTLGQKGAKDIPDPMGGGMPPFRGERPSGPPPGRF